MPPVKKEKQILNQNWKLYQTFQGQNNSFNQLSSFWSIFLHQIWLLVPGYDTFNFVTRCHLLGYIFFHLLASKITFLYFFTALHPRCWSSVIWGESWDQLQCQYSNHPFWAMHQFFKISCEYHVGMRAVPPWLFIDNVTIKFQYMLPYLTLLLSRDAN